MAVPEASVARAPACTVSAPAAEREGQDERIQAGNPQPRDSQADQPQRRTARRPEEDEAGGRDERRGEHEAARRVALHEAAAASRPAIMPCEEQADGPDGIHPAQPRLVSR